MRRRKRQNRKYERVPRRVEQFARPYRGTHVVLSSEASGVYRRPSPDIPSHGCENSSPDSCAARGDTAGGQTIHSYNREMIERERKARAEAERRKKMIAPMYNKGAYQYIGDETDEEVIRDLGRKK